MVEADEKKGREGEGVYYPGVRQVKRLKVKLAIFSAESVTVVVVGQVGFKGHRCGIREN